jgi:sporulation protein YlmC with PRC-barrel domain
MNTKFLATTAMVLIGLSGAAWAQQTAPTGKPDQAAETTNQEVMLGETATEQPLTGKDADTADTAGTDDAADPATDTAGTADTTTPVAGMATDTGSERLRSYSSSTETESFTGSVAGGLSADTLIGMSVVDSEGESVGEVSDLIIGSDDVVRHAIVEVGGFLGFGAKTTAIDLEHATVDESKGEVILDISRAEIDAMPEYQRDDEGWFTG